MTASASIDLKQCVICYLLGGDAATRYAKYCGLLPTFERQMACFWVIDSHTRDRLLPTTEVLQVINESYNSACVRSAIVRWCPPYRLLLLLVLLLPPPPPPPPPACSGLRSGRRGRSRLR